MFLICCDVIMGYDTKIKATFLTTFIHTDYNGNVILDCKPVTVVYDVILETVPYIEDLIKVRLEHFDGFRDVKIYKINKIWSKKLNYE